MHTVFQHHTFHPVSPQPSHYGKLNSVDPLSGSVAFGHYYSDLVFVAFSTNIFSYDLLFFISSNRIGYLASTNLGLSPGIPLLSSFHSLFFFLFFVLKTSFTNNILITSYLLMIPKSYR